MALVSFFFIHYKNQFCNFYLGTSENRDTHQDRSKKLNRIVLKTIARNFMMENHQLLKLCKVQGVVKQNNVINRVVPEQGKKHRD